MDKYLGNEHESKAPYRRNTILVPIDPTGHSIPWPFLSPDNDLLMIFARLIIPQED